MESLFRLLAPFDNNITSQILTRLALYVSISRRISSRITAGRQLLFSIYRALVRLY